MQVTKTTVIFGNFESHIFFSRLKNPIYCEVNAMVHFHNVNFWRVQR